MGGRRGDGFPEPRSRATRGRRNGRGTAQGEDFPTGAGAAEKSPLLPKMPPDAEGDPHPPLLPSSTLQSPAGGTQLKPGPRQPGSVSSRHTEVSGNGPESKQASA